MIIRFINANILTEKGIVYGELAVQGDTIVYVGKNRENNGGEDAQVIDLQGKIIMPGFINTHCHNPMSLFRGLGNDASFFDWWENNIKPLEEHLQSEDVYNGAMLSICEMIKNGITTSVDAYMFPDALANAFNDSKMRGFVSIGAPKGEQVDELDLKNQLQIVTDLKNPLVQAIAYAHAPYSCDEYVLAQIVKFSIENNLVFTTHASETLYEVGMSDKKHGMSPIQFLEELGVFDCKTILAHCVHVDKDDIEILKKYDTSVSTNPASNLVLGSGIAPIFAIKNADINICLGTDGVASNDSLDFFKEMFLVKNLQSGILNQPDAITCNDAINFATLNGAKALGLNNLGKIEEGYLADLIVLDNNLPNMQPRNNITTQIVQSANVQNVFLTMVNGSILYRDGEFLFVDYNSIKMLANRSIDNIKKRVEAN